MPASPIRIWRHFMDRGIMLAGDAAQLLGLPERLRAETEIAVQLAESPLTCVAVGSGKSLEEIDTIARSRRRPRVRGRSWGQKRPRRPAAGEVPLAGHLHEPSAKCCFAP